MIIVGAGVSGLAAGVTLASRGIPPLLLEQKPFAGGRAYSFRDSQTGETVDNGQHVLLTGYSRTNRFLDMIGSRSLLAVQPATELLFHHPHRGFCSFALPEWKSLLRLPAGILGSQLLPFVDRCRMLRSGRSILYDTDEQLASQTIRQWIASHHQSWECQTSFWEPLAVSIMNERIDRASALSFLRALRSAFLGSPQDARLAFPRAGLSQLYVDPAVAFIRQKEGSLLYNANVVEVLVREDRVSGVRLKDGSTFPCAALILSVPPHRIGSIVPSRLHSLFAINAWEQFTFAPIVSVHFWFQEDFMSQPFVGLVRRRTHWLFNRRQLSDEPLPGGHISSVISAAHDVVTCSNEEIIRMALEDLRSVFGTLVADPLHAVVVREKRATVSLTPFVESSRPPQHTPIPNLFLAGDWTRTGYPCTIEGAVISGETSADLATAFLSLIPRNTFTIS